MVKETPYDAFRQLETLFVHFPLLGQYKRYSCGTLKGYFVWLIVGVGARELRTWAAQCRIVCDFSLVA